jgi:hypothetical protein
MKRERELLIPDVTERPDVNEALHGIGAVEAFGGECSLWYGLGAVTQRHVLGGLGGTGKQHQHTLPYIDCISTLTAIQFCFKVYSNLAIPALHTI